MADHPPQSSIVGRLTGPSRFFRVLAHGRNVSILANKIKFVGSLASNLSNDRSASLFTGDPRGIYENNDSHGIPTSPTLEDDVE